MMRLGEILIDEDVEQAGVAARENLRYAGDRLRQQPVAFDYSEAARSLRYEHSAVGQEGHCPRQNEGAGYFSRFVRKISLRNVKRVGRRSRYARLGLTDRHFGANCGGER
jgi:hypothetical protein